MSKRPPYIKGQIYHFYNRGAHKETIFPEPENYLFVVQKLHRYCQSLHLTPLVYCLIPNHYHFLIRQDGEQRAGLLPQRIFNSYSKAYNQRYAHSGTLFESRYKVKWIQTEAHLISACPYIHANPVKDKIVANLLDWPYSNYLEWIGVRNGKLVDREFIETYFGTSAHYQEFMRDYLDGRAELERLDYLEEW